MTENLEKSYFTLDWNLINYTCFCGSAAQRIFFGRWMLVMQFYIENRFENTVFGPRFRNFTSKFHQNPAQNPVFLFYT